LYARSRADPPIDYALHRDLRPGETDNYFAAASSAIGLNSDRPRARAREMLRDNLGDARSRDMGDATVNSSGWPVTRWDELPLESSMLS